MLTEASGNAFLGASGQLYVATPALLSHYGIEPSQVDPAADLLTSRPGLGAVPHLVLGTFGPDSPGCAAGGCLTDPPIQTLHQLPTDASGPNLLITTHALQALGLQAVPIAWLIQTAQPLTATQINAARQSATAAGASIETKSQAPSLNQLRNWATAAGFLLALGVLAMTVGLIRSETAGDLRTLTATGAGGKTRRTITAATAGALALLGVLLGTAVAYLAAIAFFRSDLSTRVSHVPIADLIVLVVGLPLVATAGGWLFAGREPPAIAHQPLE
jgi:putative ABC transport system permease protein